MSAGLRMKNLLTLLVLACTALAMTAGSAWAAAEPHPHVGRLPGFPRVRGVVPVLGSQAAVSAHEQLVKGAFAEVRAHRVSGVKSTPVPNEFTAPGCTTPHYLETQEVCYQHGPVLRDPKIHLIFWQGVVKGAGAEAQVEKFPEKYEETIERYFADLAHDSGLTSNVFAVDGQYYSEEGGKRTPGKYALRFYTEAERMAEEKSTGKPIEPLVYRDTEKLPSHSESECGGPSVTHAGVAQKPAGPCLLDADLHSEVTKAAAAAADKWNVETVSAGSAQAGDLFVILTPPGVGGCFEGKSSECAYSTYCAYHGDFGGEGELPGGQSVYADIPYTGGVAGCEFFEVRPTKVEGADAAIDTISHETNESITDPLGSQCKEVAKTIVGCEPFSWTDSIGQEIGDKCLPPESAILGQAGIYGMPLGGALEENLYNQVIDADHYWTQREWSNEAGLSEGACVQRRIESSFTVSAGAQATVPMTLDGSPSGAPGDPAVYWVWDFLSTHEQVGTESATLSHTFAQAGPQRVGLTAYDNFGNSQATVEEFTVGAAPIPPPPPLTPTSPPSKVIKEPVTPGHITASELAGKLGLPANGRKLSGQGPFALGHAECPPACGVTVQLYARVTSTSHKRRTTKLVAIGSAHVALAAKGSRALSLSLTANGRQLLRRLHSLSCRLLVTVEGQEGGTWQIVRSLTLAGSGSTARRARR